MALRHGCTAKQSRYNCNASSEVPSAIAGSPALTRSRLEAHLTAFGAYINVDLAADTIQEPKVRFTNHDMAPMIIRFTVGALLVLPGYDDRGLCRRRSATRRSRATRRRHSWKMMARTQSLRG
jgi:hypothetical protein